MHSDLVVDPYNVLVENQKNQKKRLTLLSWKTRRNRPMYTNLYVQTLGSRVDVR